MKKTILNLIGNIETIKKGDNNRIVVGYGNCAIVDSQNQFIPLETLKAGLVTLLTDMSYANLMLSHQNIQIGKILQKWGNLTTHVDDKGLFLVCLTPDTKVRTGRGYKNISDINVGDKVLTHLGGYAYPVLSTMKRQYNGKIKHIYLSNREEIRITPNHPLLTKNGWKQAGELVKGDVLLKLNDTFEDDVGYREKLRALAKRTILTDESKEKNRNAERDYDYKRPYYKSPERTKIISKIRKETASKLQTGKTYEEIHGIERAKEIRKKQMKLKVNVSSRRKHVDRKEILENNHYVCNGCFVSYEHYPRYLLVHHKDNNPSNDDINNLELLCYKCHTKTFKHTAFTGIGANSEQEFIRHYHQQLAKHIGECQVCKTKDNLLVHHIADSEEPKDLMVLCRKCHQLIHHHPEQLVMNGTIVRWIEDEDYKGYVYNLQVDKANSYAGKGLIYHNCKIREDIEIANELWEQILKGEINGFSIGCELLTDPRKVCDAKGENCVDFLDKINILEVSICKFPVNKLSGFTIISKSDSSSNDVCASCGINKEERNMTEEVKEEPKVEQKDEPKELSVEERIEAIERSLFNIQAAITKMGEAYKAEEEELAKKPEEKKPEEEVKPEEEKKPADAPCKSEETLTKKDFDEFKKTLEESISKSIASIVESLKPKEQDLKMKSEMELAIKARDEQIDTLKKHVDELSAKQHIDTVEKAEANSEPKTVQDNTKGNIMGLEEDYPIVVTKGEVSHRRFVKF